MANPPSPSEQNRAAAFAHFADGCRDAWLNDFSAAADAFASTLRLDPSAEPALIARAENLRIQRNPQSFREVEAYLLAHPDSTNALAWLANSYAAGQEFPRAIELFDRLLAVNPSDPAHWIHRAGAILSRQSALEPDPEHVPTPRTLEIIVPPLLQGIPPTAPATEIQRLLAQLHVSAYNDAQDNPDADPAFKTLCLSNAALYASAVFSASPADSDVADTLLQVYLHSNQPEEALRVAEASLLCRPDDDALRRRIASIKVRLGDEDAAMALLAESSPSPPSRLDVANFFAASGLPDSAERVYRSLIADNPSDDRAWASFVAFLDDTAPRRLPSTLRRALKANPDSLILLQFDHAARMKSHRYAQALNRADRIWSIANSPSASPDDLATSFFLSSAIAAVQLRQPDVSALWLSRALARDPASIDAFTRHVVSSPLRVRRSALDALAALADLAPESPEPLYCAGSLACLLDRYAEADRFFSRLDDLSLARPLECAGIFADGTARFFHAQALDALGRPGDAIELAEKCVHLQSPVGSAALNYIAYTLSLLGRDLDKALAYALSALAREPGNPAYLDTLAWVFYRRGEPELALPHIRKAAQLRHDDPTIAEHLRAIELALPTDAAP